MIKNVFDGRVETTLTAEKGACFKTNTTDVCKNFGFFKQQACDLSLEKANMPEITIFYINQAYQSCKDNKNVYDCDFYILG